MVPFQFFLLSSIGLSPDLALRISMGTSLACIIPTSISSAYKHHKINKKILKPGLYLGIFGILGAFIGGFISKYIPSNILSIIFGILLIIVAIDILISKEKTNKKPLIKFSLSAACLFGVFVGLSSGLLGLGGGIFIIPILVIILGFSMAESVGISSVFIGLTALGGVISYIITGLNVNPFPYSLGYISLINFILIILFSVPFANIGARISYKIPERALKYVFATLLIYTSLKILGFDPLGFLY